MTEQYLTKNEHIFYSTISSIFEKLFSKKENSRMKSGFTCSKQGFSFRKFSTPFDSTMNKSIDETSQTNSRVFLKGFFGFFFCAGCDRKPLLNSNDFPHHTRSFKMAFHKTLCLERRNYKNLLLSGFSPSSFLWGRKQSKYML